MENKVIDWRLYDPVNSIFKAKATEKATLRKSYCTNSENCSLFAKGMCSLNSWGGQKCPYGYIDKREGYSKKAFKYNEFIKEAKDSVEGIKQLDSATKKIAVVGDYIYFPYAHWYLKDSLPAEIRGGIFTSVVFIPKDLFTVSFLAEILSFAPHAMMGGEIKDYQLKVVPLILTHLKEELPTVFSELIISHPELLGKMQEENYVDRKALVSTLKIGAELPTDRGLFTWNGEKLVCEDFKSAFTPFKGTTKIEIVPREGEIFKITNNNQVSEDTKFID